jgi:hypothetical protein
MHSVVIYHFLIHSFHPPSPHPFQCWRLANRHQIFVGPTLNWGNGGRYSFQIIWNYTSCPIVSGKDCSSHVNLSVYKYRKHSDNQWRETNYIFIPLRWACMRSLFWRMIHRCVNAACINKELLSQEIKSTASNSMFSKDESDKSPGTHWAISCYCMPKTPWKIAAFYFS